MHLPSRGLRLSATTMRKAGLFLAPMRFIRIFTAINGLNLVAAACHLRFLPPAVLFHSASRKEGESRGGILAWQAPFEGFFRKKSAWERHGKRWARSARIHLTAAHPAKKPLFRLVIC